ncbi:hypothetical protein [Sphingomonas alpina]|uniref:Uncharacterized protein n=1 Tax=Sphingomonas alpina TaxID=653931 RepID=A0A7H0LFL3_9SPHN|nr:hypothetical protein [Sphingomonas alpina]QNQ08466.1 hypothetical protein H3Z74_17180 [Sphingomonas alpina]
MTHSPPIPAGNQSPYPLQEPPHDHPSPPPEAVAYDDDDESREEGLVPGISNKTLGIGAAVGIGSAAIVAGLLYARSSGAVAKPESRARFKAVGRKPAAANKSSANKTKT